MENTTTSKNTLVPIAIIIGALIIGGAVFAGIFLRPGGAPSNAQETKLDAEALAAKQGTRKKKLTACLATGTAATQVKEDSDEILAATDRTAGTPFLIIEFGETSGTKSEHVVIPGAVPQSLLEQVIKDKKLPKGFPKNTVGTYRPVTAEDHIRGEVTAPVRIIEYSDLDCPFCKQIHPELKGVVDANPDVAWVYRHHPLDGLHPDARHKAEVSECVAELKGNDGFWKFVDALLAA